MPTYQLTSPTTLLVTLTEAEAAVIGRAQRGGVNAFTSAVDSVIAKFRDQYDAEDRARLINLFGSADPATRAAVFDVLEPAP